MRTQRHLPAWLQIESLLIAMTVVVCNTHAAQTTTTNSESRVPLAELTKHTKQIPFKEVILATTHHRVLDFDTNNAAHRDLFQRISTAAAAAAASARTNGLFSARANEAGNHMEAFVKDALRQAGLNARTPVTADGNAQEVGYPDVEIVGEPPCYLELKTYAASTVNTTQRSFYYSPSENPKVTRDALHLLLAYELERTERDGKTAFTPTHWKLITLQNLEVDLKFEFNQSNRGLYGKDAAKALLSEENAR
jgi:hypothetical protein